MLEPGHALEDTHTIIRVAIIRTMIFMQVPTVRTLFHNAFMRAVLKKTMHGIRIPLLGLQLAIADGALDNI